MQSSAHQFTHSQFLKMVNISTYSGEVCTILQSDEGSLTQQRWGTLYIHYVLGIFPQEYITFNIWCVQAEGLLVIPIRSDL